MRWPAFWGSGLVHLAGVAAALVSARPGMLHAQPVGGFSNSGLSQTRGGGPSISDLAPIAEMNAPHIYLAGGQSPGLGYGGASGRPQSPGDLDCPRQRALDRMATPDFPIFGMKGPFARIGKTPHSPAYCVLIGADGRVSALSVATGSGDRDADRATGRTIRGLAFHPAVRGGRAVAAWHRLVVNRGTEWLFDPNPYDVIVEPPPPIPLMID